MTLIPSSPESMVLRPSLTRAWSSAMRRRATCEGVAPLEASSAPPLSSKRTNDPSPSYKQLDLVENQITSTKISLQPPGPLHLSRTRDFAFLSRGEYALSGMLASIQERWSL